MAVDAAIIALHGIMIYGIVASFVAIFKAAASDFKPASAYAACGYLLLFCLLLALASSWMLMYGEPEVYARHNKTLKNCEDNEAYHNKIVNGVGEDPSLTKDGTRQQ